MCESSIIYLLIIITLIFNSPMFPKVRKFPKIKKKTNWEIKFQFSSVIYFQILSAFFFFSFPNSSDRNQLCASRFREQLQMSCYKCQLSGLVQYDNFGGSFSQLVFLNPFTGEMQVLFFSFLENCTQARHVFLSIFFFSICGKKKTQKNQNLETSVFLQISVTFHVHSLVITNN